MAKILIVDDEKKIVEMLEIGLNAMGYDVCAAYDGETAVEMVLKEVPDIVLLDINLPKMDGFEVCRQIRAKITDNYIPIIMVTARDDLSSKIEGLDTGADDYITKPVDIKEVMARIKSMLRIKNLQDELRFAKDELQELAVRDYLTDCYNRRYFLEILDLELKKSVRYGRNIVLLMIDIDKFKLINDTYGHPVGDKVLRKVSAVIKTGLRESDIIGRYGGEEFIVFLPNISDITNLKSICERLRSQVEKSDINVAETKINITISIGAGNFLDNYLPSIDDMISVIDKALYKAKNDGRNRYVIA